MHECIGISERNIEQYSELQGGVSVLVLDSYQALCIF